MKLTLIVEKTANTTPVEGCDYSAHWDGEEEMCGWGTTPDDAIRSLLDLIEVPGFQEVTQ